jgi:hypothetical protein
MSPPTVNPTAEMSLLVMVAWGVGCIIVGLAIGWYLGHQTAKENREAKSENETQKT